MNVSKFITERLTPPAIDNGWNISTAGHDPYIRYGPGARAIFEKDGYEVYITGRGFVELTVKTPEAQGRETIASADFEGGMPPRQVAFIEYLLERAENIVVRKKNVQD